VNSARLVLVCLILAVPLLVLVNGPIVHGVLAAILCAGLAICAVAIRRGEAEFLAGVVRPVVLFAILLVVWMLLQVAPLKFAGLAHPIWQSAEQAIGRSISGSISIDPGATVLALGQFLSALAVVLLAAAVAVNRERAEQVLFALVAATALVAVVVIGRETVGVALLNESTGEGWRSQARACVALGLIFSLGAATRTFERYETGHQRPDRSAKALMPTFIACAVALALCAVASALRLTGGFLFSAGYGVGAFLAVAAIRRIGLGFWAGMAIAAAAGVMAIVLIATRPEIHTSDLTIAFAGEPSQRSATERMLADVPWAGTGAGTFASLLPVYQDADDVTKLPVAPTTAARIAIELGRPMLWIITVGVLSAIIILLRGALQRGRDSFYPATAASSLVLLLLLSFCDNGVLGTPVGICAAAIVGIGFAQYKSRTIA
jgi:hypothetical protein